MDAAIMYRYTGLAVDKIRRLTAQGLSPLQVKGLNDDGFFGYARRIKADLLNHRERIVNFGRGQVNEELKRQRPDDGVIGD